MKKTSLIFGSIYLISALGLVLLHNACSPMQSPLTTNQSENLSSEIGGRREPAPPPPVTECFTPLCVQPKTVVSSVNMHSLSFKWAIEGDTNLNAKATIEYKDPATDLWKSALPLMRLNFVQFEAPAGTPARNELSGSILFLKPGTDYQVRISMIDPDGGTGFYEATIRTRNEPQRPKLARVMHVVPASTKSTAGSGTAADPLRGLAQAQEIARPGTTFLLHAGDYTSENGGIWVHGTESDHIVWTEAGDGEALLPHRVNVGANYNWFEGLTFRDGYYGGINAEGQYNVVKRCRFINNNISIQLYHMSTGWWITDNVFTGYKDPYYKWGVDGIDEKQHPFAGEGIEMYKSNGHTISYNTFTRVGDAMSTPGSHVDVIGNDIFETSDDGFEGDQGVDFVHVIGNRFRDINNAISFQFQMGAPWYFVKNVIIGPREDPLKLRHTERFYFLNNTVVGYHKVSSYMQHKLLNATFQNNIWLSASRDDETASHWVPCLLNFYDNSPEASAKSFTIFSHNAFGWGSCKTPFRYQTVYPEASVEAFASQTPLGAQSIRIEKEACFDHLQITGVGRGHPIPAQHLSLKAGCTAIDSGARLDNITDNFSGQAPDIGAYESGKALPQFGPRNLN